MAQDKNRFLSARDARGVGGERELLAALEHRRVTIKDGLWLDSQNRVVGPPDQLKAEARKLGIGLRSYIFGVLQSNA